MKVSVPFLKAFSTDCSPHWPAGSEQYCLHAVHKSRLPSRIPDFSSHHAHAEQYRCSTVHLCWPSFNKKVLPLSVSSPLLRTTVGTLARGVQGGLCGSLPLSGAEPPAGRNSSPVGAGTQLRGCTRFGFCSRYTTSRFRQGNHSVSVTRDGQNLLDPGRI